MIGVGFGLVGDLVLVLLVGREKAQVSTTCGPSDWVIFRDWPAERWTWAPLRAGMVGMMVLQCCGCEGTYWKWVWMI